MTALDRRPDQVRLLYASLPAALVSSVVVAGGLAVLLNDRIGHGYLLTWLVCLAVPLIQGAAIALARAKLPSGSVSDGTWLRHFRYGVGATGVAWGLSSLLLFPVGDLRLQAVLISAVAVVTAGALTSLAVDLISAALFALPALAPLIARLLVTGEEVAIATAAMLIVFLTFIAMSAIRSHRNQAENIRLRDAATARERELQLHEAFLERTGELAGVGGWDYESSTHSLRWTAQTFKIHELGAGHPPDLDSALRLFPADARQMLKEAIDAALEEGAEFDLELPLITAEGNSVWVRTMGRPRFENGTVVGVSGAIQDISARKFNDDALMAARNEADRANLAKSNFLSHMSHELRTPMNAVLGFAQLLEADPSSSLQTPQAAYVQHILKAGRHLLHLINELLDLGRAESGKFQINLSPVDVGEVIADCLTLVQPGAVETRIRLEYIDSHAKAMVLADRTRLRQVLLNLISNAIKFNRDEGSVQILVEPDDIAVRVSVRDTGYGLSPAQQQRLFKVFERLDADQAQIGGTGIGLALSKQLVELMDGEIGVSSDVDVGSVFWVRLPRPKMTGTPEVGKT